MDGRAGERERFFARLSLLLGCALLGVMLGGVAAKLRTSPLVSYVDVPRSLLPDAGAGSLPPLEPTLDLSSPPSPPLADAGAPSQRELWALVVDSAGQPVEGVSVLARPGLLTLSSATGNAASIGELGVLPGSLPFPDDVIAGQNVAAGRIERATASSSSVWVVRSDRQGHAHFPSLPSGRLLLLANFSGKSASAEVEIPIVTPTSQAATALRVVLRLASPVECAESLSADASESLLGQPGMSTRTDLRGRVLDHRGFAVSSARIDATVGGSRQQISSDVRGQFVLPLLPSGDVRLSIRAPGFAPLVQTVKLEQRRDEVRFELRPGGGISGQVEDARVSGLPDGLAVFLELPGGERLPIAVAPDGHFTETGVPTGTVVLRARARGYAAVQKVLQVPEGSSPDQVTLRDVRLRFVRGAQLLGQVRLAGRSFEGADIQVQNEEGQLLARTRTDRRGEFELADLPPGKLRVQASSAQGSASQTVELRPGDRPQIELELAGR